MPHEGVPGVCASERPAPGLTDPAATLRQLMRIRRVEEEIAGRYGEQEMRCPVHLSIGQEAAAVGVCAALTPSDYAFSTHRGHAHYLAKGGDLKAMMAEIYGRAPGCAGGRGGSMHLIDLSVNMMGCTPIVGGSLPVAVGAAFASWLDGRQDVTVVFFGEAVTEEGVFFESVNFAALKQLPIIFACENNGFSVYSPMSVRQPSTRDRVGMTRENGLKVGQADGNDVEAVHALACEAVADVRQGGGPWYLEFETYRLREHCGPNVDNALAYRDEAEWMAWRQRCPVEAYRSRLLERGDIDAAGVHRMEVEIAAEIEGAFDFARSAPFPTPESLLSRVLVDEVMK